MDLSQLRQQIDTIDRQIVDLYEERMDVSRQVAEYKIETGKKVFDKQREQEKIAGVKALTHNDFNSHGVEELFEQIMSMSRKLQYQLLAAHGSEGRLPFIGVEELETDCARVVYQGAEGSYSQAAMRRFFGENVNAFHVETFRDAMSAIDEGSADFAVLPIENTTAGIVADIYDLLTEYELSIVGEQIIRPEHVLLGLPDAELEDIRQVCSHPQALSQCGKYLESHPDWKKKEMENTAGSAKKIKEDNDKTQAAIASRQAGELYGLKILAENICYNGQNATRFVIVSKKPIYVKDAHKISIFFELHHESGTLYNMLSHIIYNGLNMTKIESRPITGKNWQYRFFVDFEGNLKDSAVKNALRGIEAEADRMRILGNY